MEWIEEALEIFKEQDLLNDIMKLLVPYNADNICTSSGIFHF